MWLLKQVCSPVCPEHAVGFRAFREALENQAGNFGVYECMEWRIGFPGS